jgi:ribosomal protein L11 methyltransferase
MSGFRFFLIYGQLDTDHCHHTARKRRTCRAILTRFGWRGAQIEDTQVVLDESEDATLEPRERAVVTSYLAPELSATEATSQLHDALQRAAIEAEVQTSPLPDEDWTTSWRENFPPLHIGPFSYAAAVGRTRRQPGASSFASTRVWRLAQDNTRPTRMCLELLAEQLNPWPNDTPKRVLDVGCGSGILSIAAAKLGAEVWASDLDPFCTRATEENTQVNDVAQSVHIVEAAGADWTQQQFPLVVANLMSALLIQLASQLAARVHSGGRLLVSGISAPRADDVENAMHAVGFETLQKRELDGESRGEWVERWTAFVFRKI